MRSFRVLCLKLSTIVRNPYLERDIPVDYSSVIRGLAEIKHSEPVMAVKYGDAML